MARITWRKRCVGTFEFTYFSMFACVCVCVCLCLTCLFVCSFADVCPPTNYFFILILHLSLSGAFICDLVSHAPSDNHDCLNFSPVARPNLSAPKSRAISGTGEMLVVIVILPVLLQTSWVISPCLPARRLITPETDQMLRECRKFES